MTGAGIVVEGLTVLYRLEQERTCALDAVSLTMGGGEVTAVLGPSGSGKSTLMAVLGGLQRATSGSVRIGGTEITALSARALLALRRERVAVVVQDPRRNLIPHGSAVDNVRFAQGAGRRQGRIDPRALLADLGLEPIADAPVDRMSGGERQRVAIATGLAIDPEVLLVDEPTSALDERTRDDVLAMLLTANRRTGTTVVLITHDEHVADRADRRIRLQDGRVVP